MSTEKERTSEVHSLLVKAADGQLDESEKQRFDQLAQADPSLLEELADFETVGQTLSEFGIRNPNPDDWNHFEKSLRAKSERATGWLLLLLGYLVLVGVAIFFFMTDPTTALIIKIPVAFIIFGFLVLVYHVGRRFLRERKSDPYKDIIR